MKRRFAKNACLMLGSLCGLLNFVASAEQLIIRQNPGAIDDPISFLANGALQLDPTDTVAEFIVEFSPKALANPLGDFSPFSSFRTIDWGTDQDLSGLTITEYVSDGADQVVPIGAFEPVTVHETGYTAGDVPFPGEFPFALRQFGVRIEGLQGGPLVSFEKDAQSNSRGGGQVIHSAQDYMPIRYDNLRDDIEVFTYQLAGGATMEFTDAGLNFRSSSPVGIDFFDAGEHVIVSDSVSIRAKFTINEVVALGLAGVGIENPARWAAVLGASHDEEYGVGQNLQPEKVKIPEGEITDDPFIVQLDFTEDELTGYFWRPESPRDVTTIQYQQNFSVSDGPLRLANNGTDVTYHDIWVSDSHIPLPTGFEDLGDFNGNQILDSADLQFVASNIQLGDTQTDLNGDAIVNETDLNVWVKEYFGSWIGDSNLDGVFDSGDLVDVFAAGEYEDDIPGNSTWATGDWNGNGEFDSGDLVAAFKDAGFEQGTRTAHAIPEPKTLTGVVGLICLFLIGTRSPRATFTS